MGHVSTRQELVAILRRFDMDGDAKINFKEFQIGMKSSLTVFGKKKTSVKRPRSSGGYHIKVTNMAGRNSITPRRSFASPKFTQACDIIPPRKGRISKSGGRVGAGTRKKLMNQMGGHG